jgi:hypothetical protein
MKQVVQRFPFQSSSNPGVEYRVLLYVDGSLSCGCRGWTFTKPNQRDHDGNLADRACKHTRQVREWIARGSAGLYSTSGRADALPTMVRHIARTAVENKLLRAANKPKITRHIIEGD